MTKAALRSATTRELIDVLAMRDEIEWIQIDSHERCQIAVEADKPDRIAGFSYKSAGHSGPEVIMRYRPQQEAS